jgi:sortase A
MYCTIDYSRKKDMDPNNRQLGQPFSDQPAPDQSVSLNQSAASVQQPAQHRDAAANVIRSRIDSLYNGSTVVETTVQPEVLSQTTLQSSLETQNPYHRSHNDHPLPQAEQWKAYHSAWQQYYQKYYEQYYTHETEAHKQRLTAEQQQAQQTEQNPQRTYEPETVTQDQAITELRAKLLGKVQESAKKVRKSRHFLPIIAAVAVVFIFVFIQYNRVFIANVQAYVAPGNLDPQNIVIDPTSDVAVSNDPRLIIPKINVDVPVMYDVGVDNASQMAAMEKGVAHFPIAGANSHPGEIGNTVLAGHSSNDLFDPGAYKFIFAQLEKLQVGDTIYANYNSKRYTYVITKTETVKPTEVNKLIYPTTKPVITLITCTPLGTALNRLLVTAEQVSPDPSAAAAAPSGSGSGGESSPIPGNSPTVFERLFGAN